jgi:hypothetical protein
MEDRGLRHLDEIAQVRAEIEALMAFLGRSAEIAVEQHDVGNVLRIGDDLADEIRAVACRMRSLSHCLLP